MKDLNYAEMKDFRNRMPKMFEAYCYERGVEPDTQNLITYLLDTEVIQRSKIRKFNVINEFKLQLQENGNIKTHAVNAVASRFDLSDRSVWAIIKKYFY